MNTSLKGTLEKEVKHVLGNCFGDWDSGAELTLAARVSIPACTTFALL